MERERLGSRLGFILLSAGCAIGCGNVWKFPWMTGQYGGGGFVLIYIICLIVIGLPGMVMEFSLGRASQASPVKMYKKLEKPNQKWHIHGYLCLIGNICLMAFYTVVTGWIFKYAFMGINGGLFAMGTDMATIGGTFGGTAPEAATLGEAIKMMLDNGIFGIGNGVWQIIGLVISLVIMIAGIAGGIEKANKVMMPVLFALFVGLAIYIATLPGAEVGYSYIFTSYNSLFWCIVISCINISNFRCFF